MPTPPLSDALALEALEALEAHQHKAKNAAAALGINYSAFQHRVSVAKSRGLHFSAGAQNVVRRAGLSGSEAKGGWIHDYDEEGKKVGTTRWSAPPDEVAEESLSRMREAFEGLLEMPPVDTPSDVAADLCNVIPLFDVHWGMAAWGEETGDVDYNIELARDDMMRGLGRVLSVAPAAQRAVLILGGDLTHADDNNAQTPKSKHPLDVAARMHRVTDSAIEIIKFAVHRVLEKNLEVVIRVLRGNHDPNSHRAIAFALREWTRSQPRVTVDMDPREMFMMQWGRTAMFAQHGDRMKAVDLSLKLADVCPFWSECPHRYAYTGHLHRMSAERIGGLNWERLEPFAPSDDYGATWVNRRAMKIDTYHNQRGRILTAIDPLER
jgi:hypothetical protein|tara:strand:+ start:787 stop:1926 length:1140 start_codon:yes stop_codon:yes gene_type:complete